MLSCYHCLQIYICCDNKKEEQWNSTVNWWGVLVNTVGNCSIRILYEC